MTRAAQRVRAAAIYCRISQDGTGRGLGVARQEMDCRAIAKARGWSVGRVYVDNDMSAYRGTRPAYKELLDDVSRGAVDAVVVWHLDRLHRHPGELEDFFKVCDAAGIGAMASVSGDIDLATDDGRLYARILGAMAKKESDDKKRRIKRKHLELAKNGQPLGGFRPYGYEYHPKKKRLTINKREAAIVRQIFTRFADEGWSLKQLSHDLNDRGIVGALGKRQWHSNHVARMIDNPGYAGYRHYRGELTRGTWTPIVAEDLWRRAETRRKATKARTPAEKRVGKGTNTLSSLLYCKCGAPMWRNTHASNGTDKSSYECSKSKTKKRGDCTAGGVGATRIETGVAQQFIDKITPAYLERLAARGVEKPNGKADPGAELRYRLDAIDKQLDRLVNLAISAPGPATERKFQAKATALEEERADVERRLAQVEVDAGGAVRSASVEQLREIVADLPRIWGAATTEERNLMLKLAVERVDITTTTRPKEFAIRWADWLS